jgi:rSAM/selenodomain-associated transferase 1
MKNSSSLIIIAKYPEKKSVKTRLKGLITDEARLNLYVSLLEQTVSKLRDIPGVDTFIAYAPRESEGYFSRFGVNLIPLPDGDIGARMFHAFREVFGKGYKKAALVGADIPDISDSTILKAIGLLSANDVVFGPAEDGGYYLVGMRRLIKEIFDGVPWSSRQTLKRSVERADLKGFSVALSDTLSDIDTIEDLKRTGFSIRGKAGS